MSPDAVVVGAGCAGLAAATSLAERGARVRLLEARPTPGGRSRSFTDPATGDLEDNGQHVLLGCYTELLRYVERIGAAHEIAFQERLEVVLREPGGAVARFRPGLLPPPFDLLWGMARMRGFPLRDALAAGRVLRDEPHPGTTAAQWLARCGQGPAARRLLWDPLVLATLNTDAGEAAATLVAAVVRRALSGGRDAARIGWPRRGLGPALVEPGVAHLLAHGGEIRLSAAVRALEVEGDRAAAAIDRQGERHPAGSFVLALPPGALAAIEPPLLAPQVAERLGASPIVAAHVWLDREITDEPMTGLLDSPVHWVFDRWRMGGARTPGALALVSSGATTWASRAPEEIAAQAVAELRRYLPRAAGARVLRQRVLKERAATVRLTPDVLPLRASAATRLRNVVLAGDWTDTGLPATLEGAAASGHRAAALLSASR